MGLRILDTANGDVASAILKVSPGKYKHLYIGFEGIAEAGLTLTLAMLGTILAVKRTRNFISNVKMTNMMHIANVMGGIPNFEATVASTSRFFIPILCYDASAPENILDVQEEDAFTFTLTNLALFTTTIASGTYTLYGEDADGVQHYIPLLNQVTEVIGGAGNVVKQLTGENFVRVFINGMDDTDISKITIRQDGFTKVNGSPFSVRAMSNFESNIESQASGSPIGTGYETGLVFAHIPLSHGQPSELLSDSLEYDITTTGAASPEIISVTLDFTPDEQALSQASAIQKLNTKLTNKEDHGKGRPVTALKQMVKIPDKTSAVISNK
jgi:hypothetical protein